MEENKKENLQNKIKRVVLIFRKRIILIFKINLEKIVKKFKKEKRDSFTAFEKLTPKKDVSSLEIYEDALKFVFNDNDITNIAITGVYGSGKSSITRTFLENNEKIKFLHVSLANFVSIPSTSDQNITKELEGKILNQIIHQIPYKRIPKINLSTSHKLPLKNWLIPLLFVISLIFIILYSSTQFANIRQLINTVETEWIRMILDFSTTPYLLLIAIVIAISSALLIICYVVYTQGNRNILRKISVGDYSLDLFNDKDDSYFDRHLSEIIYVLENSKYNTIIFEDIERYEVENIFTKLREINVLLNIRRKGKGKKPIFYKSMQPIRFFYLIRDNIFDSKERVKFFDFIIPIIPVIDSSNSYTKMTTMFERYDIDKSFLQATSLYIDEMRILYNIYNEFIVYTHRLKQKENKTTTSKGNMLEGANIELDSTKILAIIIYKNLFPKDFSELQLRKGFIFEIVSEKKELIANKTVELREEQRLKRNTINEMGCEHMQKQVELEILEKHASSYFSNCHEMSSNEKKELKNEILSGIPDRKKNLTESINGMSNALQKEIDELQREIDNVQLSTIQELLGEGIFDNVLNKLKRTDIQESPYLDLLKVLLNNGYIDEHYENYMAYFYPGHLSQENKNFMMRLVEKRGENYSDKLPNAEQLIGQPIINKRTLSQVEILNFNFFEYIIRNKKNCNICLSYLEEIVLQLKNSANVKFPLEYYYVISGGKTGECVLLVDDELSKNKTSMFIVAINETWTSFFSTTLENRSNEQIKKELPIDTLLNQLSIDILYYCSDEVIKQINNTDVLSSYISNPQVFFNIKSPNVERLVSGFKLLGARLKNLNYSETNKELFYGLYENHLYELNRENISLLLNKNYNPIDEEEMWSKNYTLIQKKPEEPLAQYIDKNIQDYMEIVLTDISMINDDEKMAIQILNSNLNGESKYRYMTLLTTTINDISKIDETLWTLLFEECAISFTSSNIINYFQSNGLNGFLIDELNHSEKSIDFSNVEELFSTEVKEEFFYKLTLNEDIDIKKYGEIVSSLGCQFDRYEETSISEEKMTVLIENRLLAMDWEELIYIHTYFEGLLLTFVKLNFKVFLSLLENFVASKEEMLPIDEWFSQDDYLEMLEWEYSDNDKIRFLKHVHLPVQALKNTYSDELKSYIVRNCIIEDEIPTLFKIYSTFSEKTKNAIYDLSKRYIGLIISYLDSHVFYEIDADLLERLLTEPDSSLIDTSGIQRKHKIELFTKIIIPKKNEELFESKLQKIGRSDLENLFTYKANKRYENIEENEIILKALIEHDMISDYEIDNRNNKFRVTKK